MLRFLLVFLFFPILSFAEKKDVVIINTNTAASSQVVKNSALKPSSAKKIRGAREDAEITTESLVLEKLEKERLKSEQNLLNKIFGGTSGRPATQAVSSPQASASETRYLPFGERAYISLGFGFYNYPGVENINDDDPVPVLSFGGYARDNFIFDFSFIYSNPYVDPLRQGFRYGVRQLIGSVAMKFSPFKGKIKPYGGLSGSFIGRNWNKTTPEGELYLEESRDVASKKWYQSFDGGLVGGVDVAVTRRVGVNLDMRWHWNAYTETRDGAEAFSDTELLDRRDSFILTANFRFYF